MEGKCNISDYRSRLDETLASPDLTNDESIRTLVKNQILQSSHFQFEEYIDNVVERRSKEVSNVLTMLRSASVNDVERSKYGEESHAGWKLKQDTDEFRVMYRQGPEGAPFHTLLVEGYVDGPVDACLCISWESALYKKWWPQTAIPTFKVISSQCLQRVRTGEQISLVRMKVSWPLSSREALIHYFSFEYFQDDLVVVLLNSIPDSETINRSTHGFTREAIPDAEEVVRIDVVGGFALQKVTANRSYFRTIANMDIKLDFVPPAFINFISRQLIGSGFKLYKKEIASVSRGDDDKFHEALSDPLYVCVREALYSGNSTESQDVESLSKNKSVMVEDQNGQVFEDDNVEENNWCDDSITDIECKINEIEELEEDDTNGSESLDNCTKSSDHPTDQFTEKFGANKEELVISSDTSGEKYETGVWNKVRVSREVQGAMETLEKAISMFREHNGNAEKDRSGIKETDLSNLDKSMFPEADEMNENGGEAPKIGSQELNSLESRISSESHASRQKGSNSYTRIVPASPDEDRPNTPVHENTINGDKENKKKNKKSRFCCLRTFDF